MKLAIMQPYLFPYLGYFQMIAAVDKFVIYDDVAFMKQGWVNRNQILVDGKTYLFSVPVQGASSHRAIRETLISRLEYPRWKDKFLKTLALAYSKAPNYESTRSLLLDVIDSPADSIAELAFRSIVAICERLNLSTRIEPSSTIYGNGYLHAQDRVLDICAREGATFYLNASGGRDLYSAEAFSKVGIELRFLLSRLPPYPQFNNDFVPALSMVDILMFNTVDRIRSMLPDFNLV